MSICDRRICDVLVEATLMNALARARRYRDWAEESVALAKAAISNEMRAQHYAIAQHFHRLAEAELKAATSSPAGEFEVSAPRSAPISIN
jgi:hypothetical protein